MEPDKTYPLHADDTSQSGPSTTPPESQQYSQPEVLSKYGQSKDTVLAPSNTVPWYLRPLTKQPESPLTSTQTRPFISREPQPQSPTQAQPEPTVRQSDTPPQPQSPFRSPSFTASEVASNERSSPSVSSTERFQMPGQLKSPVYQEALSSAVPKPFSHFDSQAPKHPPDSTPAQPKKPRKIVAIVLVVLLVGAIGAGVYALWRSNSNSAQRTATPTAAVTNAEEKLYQAIENHLSTGKVRQVFEQTVTAGDTSTFKIDATSDFSDPRTPKSYIKYEVKSGKEEAAINGAGELVIQDAHEYYGKLTKPALLYEGSETAKPKENQWYVVASDDPTGELLLDPLSTRTSINSPLGEFPVGGFSESTRRQLMQYIKDQNVYTIQSSERVEVNGKKLIHYQIDFDADAVNELNKRIYTEIGGNAQEMPVVFTKNGTHKTEVWVGDDTTKITRIKIARESKTDGGDTVKENIMVNVTYPNDLSIIRKPENTVAGPWVKAR